MPPGVRVCPASPFGCNKGAARLCVHIIPARRKWTWPILRGGGDVEVVQARGGAAEGDAGDLRDRQFDAAFHAALRVVADDLPAVPLGAVKKTVGVGGQAVGDAFVVWDADEDTLAARRRVAGREVVSVDGAGGAVGEVEDAVVGAEGQAVGELDVCLLYTSDAADE